MQSIPYGQDTVALIPLTGKKVDGVDHETLLKKEPQYGIPAENQPAAYKVVDL